MADAMFDTGRQAFCSAGINLATDTIKCALVAVGYAANLATDQYFSTVNTGGNVVGTPQVIPFTSDTAGVWKAGNVNFGAVTGSQVTQLVIFKSTGVDASSQLIARLDGTQTVTCAVAPTGTFTSIQVDPLRAAIASGTAITFSGASGAVTVSGAVAVGARSVPVTSTSVTGIAAGATANVAYPSGTPGLPYTPNGATLTFTPDAVNGILKL